ncbi:MAG: tetratricopeptide repeat protein [Woeseiaceae bacterium]
MQSNEQKDHLSPRLRDIAHGQDLKDGGDYEGAYNIAYNWLRLDPEDPAAMCLLIGILCETDKIAIAHPIAKRLTQIAPEAAVSWLNYGRCAGDLWQYKEAERAYKKALSLSKDDKTKSSICVNVSCMMVDHGRFKEAEKYARQAVVFNPDSTKGKANLGFCQLAQRDWAEGWKNYRYCIGENGRYYAQYNNEPMWTGEEGTILVYCEQGLGDEISFAQMLPEMQEWCDKHNSRLIVDVQHRLKPLIQRSFPDIEVHGSRSQKYCDFDASVVDYSISIGQLGEFFRTKDEEFTGEPYLVPDQNRVEMWKHLFKSKKKPVIGIGWQGGTWKTATKFRQLTLEQLLPVLKSVDAHWVSLQYKPAGKQIEEFRKAHPEIDIVEYAHATLSQDYDDTVAMIAAMDMIVTMQTTTVHVAGGLGIPAWTFVPRTSQWRYGEEGEDFPWANSVRLIRQTTDGMWDDVMEKTGEELANFPRVSGSTAKDARKQEVRVRNDSGKVRRNNKRTRKSNGGESPSGLRLRKSKKSDGDVQADERV